MPRLLAQLALLFGLLGSWSAWAKPLPEALRRAGSIDEARAAVQAGAARWPEYLRWLRAERRSVFERNELAANARQGKLSLLERDHKLVVLRDQKALRSVEGRPIEEEHLLGVPTWGRRQPSWLNEIAPRDAASLGRMVRVTLETPRHPARETYGYFHMPGGISQPITHFHVKWRPASAPRVADWDAFLAANYQRTRAPRDGGYRIYRVRADASAQARAWPVLAVAGGAPTLGRASDELIGRMFLALGRSAIRGASFALMTRGELQIDHAERRLVVRLAASALD